MGLLRATAGAWGAQEEGCWWQMVGQGRSDNLQSWEAGGLGDLQAASSTALGSRR